MELINFFLIVVALDSSAILLRLLILGYRSALLPVICVIAYIPLEFVWAYSGYGEAIGNLQDTAWSLVEMGVIGGSAGLAWSIYHDLSQTVEQLRKELREYGQPSDSV